jgi:hypothetical protein
VKLSIPVWNLTGRPSGKYLAVTMGIWLPKLEQHAELDTKRLTDHTRAQLLKVSGATIDRMLKPTRDGNQLVGLSGTRPGPLLLRNSIQVRKAGDEHEQEPGFVEADLVLHGGATLKGEFVHTLTVTDVSTGWTENMALKNGAHRWVIEAMTVIEAHRPFPLVGLDTDKGGEFINHALIRWAGDRDLFFTRSRPYKPNDNAHVERKDGDVVRPHASHYRYDTVVEPELLNELYLLVRVRFNLFTATTHATGWRSNKHGKKTRVYDPPRTPYQRAMDSGVLTAGKAGELAALFEDSNPAELTRKITVTQTRLIALAKTKPALSPRVFRNQNQLRHGINFREHLDMRHYGGATPVPVPSEVAHHRARGYGGALLPRSTRPSARSRPLPVLSVSSPTIGGQHRPGSARNIFQSHQSTPIDHRGLALTV